MRRALLCLAQFVLFCTPLAPGVHAQSPAATVQDFGLIGRWAIECGRPPSPGNEHSVFTLASGGTWVLNDFGPDYDGMIYRVLDAERVSDDKLSLHQVLSSDETVVLDMVMLKSNDRIRVWSSRMRDGTFLVSNGSIVSTTDQPTRWSGRCGERRAG